MRYLLLVFGGILAVGLSAYKISTNGRYNDEFDELFKLYAGQQGISAKLLKAIAMNESGPRFKHRYLEPIGGTYGILHIKLSTARDYEPNLTARELRTPEVQIRVASKHIKRLLEVFRGDIDKVVMSYNAGEGNIAKGRIPKTTKEYLERFKRNHNRLGVA